MNSSSDGQQVDLDEFELRKRLPSRFSNRKNDIYVTKKTNFKAQLSRCQRLVDDEYAEIYVHGLGAAVDRAINLCLQLKRRALGSIDLDVRTSTMQMTDDLYPLIDDADIGMRTRFVSAVHIRVYRPTIPVDDY